MINDNLLVGFQSLDEFPFRVVPEDDVSGCVAGRDVPPVGGETD